MQAFYLVVLGLPNGSFVECSGNPDKLRGYRPKSINIFGIPQNNRHQECLDYCEMMAAASGIKIQFHSSLDNQEQKV